jgi:hypothetical protein
MAEKLPRLGLEENLLHRNATANMLKTSNRGLDLIFGKTIGRVAWYEIVKDDLFGCWQVNTNG